MSSVCVEPPWEASENGLASVLNCKVSEGGWVLLILFLHIIAANEKPRVRVK